MEDTENSVDQARVRLYKTLQLLKLPNPAHRAMDVPSCLPIDGYVRGPLIQAQLRSSGYNQSTILSTASRETDGPPSTETGDGPSRRTGDPPRWRTIIRQAGGRVIRQAGGRVIREAGGRAIRKAGGEVIPNVSSICVVLILTLGDSSEKSKRAAAEKSSKRLRAVQG